MSAGSPSTFASCLLFLIAIAFFVVTSGKSTSIYRTNDAPSSPVYLVEAMFDYQSQRANRNEVIRTAILQNRVSLPAPRLTI